MKKGFTLIELLAVIVILAIISLIATPIILGMINNAKENAFKESINGILRSASVESALKIKGEELLYKYEDNKWGENELKINGQIPKYVEIKVNKKGQTRYAITDGIYCVIKEYEGNETVKKK